MGSFYDLLKKRRAVRSYTGERVPRETLERIARAARRGPNAGYSQGLRLLVVDDLLGIPDDLTIVTGVTVGHPAEDPDWDRASSVFSQRRRGHDEVIQWNHWAL